MSAMKISNYAGPQLLRTQVYEFLRTQLKEGTLKPGMSISINQLIVQSGISWTPLRDALLQLQTERFVIFLPQRGIRINELSQQDIEDFYEMLGALDSRASLSVVDTIGTKEIDGMKAINHKLLTLEKIWLELLVLPGCKCM
jgi:DNA-binding GntR family transcriptional regulator